MQTVSVLFVGADLSADSKQPRAQANGDTLGAYHSSPQTTVPSVRRERICSK